MTKYEWTSNGNNFRLEARCTASLKPVSRLYDACDARHFTDKMEIVYDALLEAYVNGKRIDSTRNTDLWKVVNLAGHPGYKRIVGIDRIGFTDKIAEDVVEFLNTVIAEGTPADVAEFTAAENAAEQARKNAKAIRECQKIIDAFEAQDEKPETRDEARRMMNKSNRFYNEGGEGFVNRIYSREEYAQARKELSELA